MPRVDCVKTVDVVRTPRVMQLEGLFDLPPSQQSARSWSAELPLDDREWTIGLIVGPSGCGKSTLARALFPQAAGARFDWPRDRALVDAFPEALGIREVAELLSSVGFSSPPAWLRPFHALSNGEQFRVTVARALAHSAPVTVIDEYSSVVDRTVARIASCAIARTLRRRGTRFVAVSCHYDIIDWLAPDWIYDPALDRFDWRSLRPRPGLTLEISRAPPGIWRAFKLHHYLSGDLNPAARAFTARVEGRLAAFTAVLSHPDPRGGYWREHRTVCLPDFQGVGLGHALSEFVASLFAATGKRYLSVTSHPGMIAHRRRSHLWSMYRAPSFGHRNTGRERAFNSTAALFRRTAGFRYIGPPNPAEARRLGLPVPATPPVHPAQ